MKTIGQLAALVKGAAITGNPDTGITGIEHDSRKVGKGTLFVCIPGVHVDGHTFIPQAVAAGAKAILTTRTDVMAPEGVAVLRVPELQTALDTIVRSSMIIRHARCASSASPARTARRRRAISRALSCAQPVIKLA